MSNERAANFKFLSLSRAYCRARSLALQLGSVFTFRTRTDSAAVRQAYGRVTNVTHPGEMETFEVSLQDMIDCDMRAHLGSLTTVPLELDPEFIGDSNPWPPTSLVYSDLEPTGLFVNPQTAMPSDNPALYSVQSACSPAAADTPRSRSQPIARPAKPPEPTGGDAAPRPTSTAIDGERGRLYPKPTYSYSCLIAMALRNSKTGNLPVSEIYGFMMENFPFFKTAPNGWKNSVRHNLSLNKCFEKVKSCVNNTRKGCLWTMNPSKVGKMEEEMQKWSRKDPQAIRRSMAKPEILELLEKGCVLRKESSEVMRPLHSQYQPTYSVKAEPLDHGELDLLDTGLHLDASLPDLNLQSGIWDEFEEERQRLDLPPPVMASAYQGSFVFNPHHLVATKNHDARHSKGSRGLVTSVPM